MIYSSRTFFASASYFALVFLLGFAFGLLRVLVLAPKYGEVAAVLIEVPIVLALAWPPQRCIA